MTTSTRHMRGQPVAALVLVMGLWILGRALTWVPLAIVPQPPAKPRSRQAPPAPETAGAMDPPAPPARALPASVYLAPVGADADAAIRSSAAPHLSSVQIRGHQGHMSIVPSPAEPGEGWRQAEPSGLTPTITSQPSADRWSGDSWVFLRPGGPAALSSAAAPSYGASQAGAVLRYRLAPDSALRPTAYLRATSALGAVRQKEAALGMSIRPFPRVPVVLMGEARVGADAAGRHVRPAAMLVTQLAPSRVPAGLEAELYAQGGYIAGQNATPFGDAQARVTRRVIDRGRTRFDLGGGAWAGGQRGAARVDLGPTASLSLPVGAGTVQIAADWRVRVAGDAQPASGPALTISAGF